MKTLWFITNPGSGSTTKAKCEAIEAVFEEHGLVLAGRSEFPAEKLPMPAQLDRQAVDTVVLFAGDGTINAALCALARWEGAFLILPGGTMNLLAKLLHGTSDPHRIIAAAHDLDRRVALPFVEAGAHRAFVGVILGPAIAWARAREAARHGRLWRLIQAARVAWERSLGHDGIRLRGVAGLNWRYQAVFVRPAVDGLNVTVIDAHDWSSILAAGWDWLTGGWVADSAVSHTQEMKVDSKRPVVALFDGEPVTLDPGTPFKSSMSREAFLSTREEV